MSHTHDYSFLIGAVLHDLAVESESLLVLSNALENHVSGISSAAVSMTSGEAAAIIKSAALQVGVAAANIVGAAERLRLVAELGEIVGMTGGRMRS